MRAMIFLMLLSGCSAIGSGGVDPSKKYACNEAYICPQGQSCAENCCGGPPCSGDYYEAKPTDQTPTVTLGPADGCASGMGYELVPGKVYACPGAFTGGAKKQCAAKPGEQNGDYYHCTLVRGFGQFEPALKNFFASAVPMEQFDEGAQCGWQSKEQIAHYMAGIGGIGKSYVMEGRFCAGWTTFVRVDGTPGDGWSVKLSSPPVETDVDTLSNANPDDGVICCRGLI